MLKEKVLFCFFRWKAECGGRGRGAVIESRRAVASKVIFTLLWVEVLPGQWRRRLARNIMTGLQTAEVVGGEEKLSAL